MTRSEAMNTLEDQQRLEFESHCRTIGCEWSLEWDKAGFYEDAKADAAFTWFQIGFQRGLGASTTPTDPELQAAMDALK